MSIRKQETCKQHWKSSSGGSPESEHAEIMHGFIDLSLVMWMEIGE